MNESVKCVVGEGRMRISRREGGWWECEGEGVAAGNSERLGEGLASGARWDGRAAADRPAGPAARGGERRPRRAREAPPKAGRAGRPAAGRPPAAARRPAGPPGLLVPGAGSPPQANRLANK